MTLLDQLVIAPIVIPAIAAPLALLAMRRRRRVGVAISLAGCGAMLVAALALFGIAQDDAIRAYPLGGWPAPFGIVLVLDRLSAMMLVLASAGDVMLPQLQALDWTRKAKYHSLQALLP